MTPDGAQLAARVIRPRNGPATLPALLEFTLGDDPNSDLRETAAHGYVGVVTYVRSPATSQVLVFEHDGADATAVINWITHQSWSDGRVGMFGMRYSGFTAWAALRELPPALKAVATADATAPGIDFPMRNGIFRSQALSLDPGCDQLRSARLLQRERGCLLAPAGEALVYQRRSPFASWISSPVTPARCSSAG